ncbi:VOC family protein [Streptomyces sp. SKN60]|uniref:VOC family protein n=1 Tax=Streptomyces sp. SKN60 TaxID=2855506 RepID=UPI00224814E2|nr:VOC family protein [Streptomyces sp. SKN60]MCX2181978.1 VOC family protein [Streptomyces sp. SKN60]
MADQSLNQGLDHIAIRVYDLDASVEFYTRGLGFRFVQEWSAGGVHRAAFLDAGDDRLIELFSPADTPPGGSPYPLDAHRRPSDAARAENAAVVHLAVRTRNVPALYEQAVQAGARPMGGPFSVRTRGDTPMTFQAAFIFGPNDEVIELINRPNATVGGDAVL